MIALIDYGSGNLLSAAKALEAVGATVRLVSEPSGLEGAAGVVLPGVGAFGDAVASLEARGLTTPLKDWLHSGRPFLGICIGYQLLFESSEESPGAPGLGFFGGTVVRFTDKRLKIPHMGWNSLQTTPHQLWQGLPDDPYLFFVHSFHPAPSDNSSVIARADYGGPFAAASARGNVAGVQFHPEKSQAIGLRILCNWIASVPGAGE